MRENLDGATVEIPKWNSVETNIKQQQQNAEVGRFLWYCRMETGDSIMYIIRIVMFIWRQHSG